MADKIVVDIFRNKSAEDFTKALSSPDSRMDTGSGAAAVAAVAASFLLRAAQSAARSAEGNERIEYIVRNGEILRSYMVHLIDEDVKCRAPLNRALREGGEREIEACRQTAVAICNEITNMMGKCLELADELSDLCGSAELRWLGDCAQLALSAMKLSMSFAMNMANSCCDDTFRFVAGRENEMELAEFGPIADRIIKKAVSHL